MSKLCIPILWLIFFIDPFRYDIDSNKMLIFV